MRLAWPGPIEGGVTQSLISRFLECPYRFYLYAGLGLDDPEEFEVNLAWGTIFHYGLEQLIAYPKTVNQLDEDEWLDLFSKIKAFIAKEYPSAPSSFLYSICSMLKLYDDSYKTEPYKTEQKFNVAYTTRRGLKCNLRGKVDGINQSKTILVEHKCKGKIDIQQTRLETPLDLQALLYCYVNGPRRIIYDLIRIPEAQWKLPDRRMNEKVSAYIERLFKTHTGDDYPIRQKKHLWIQQCDLSIDNEEIDNLLNFTLNPLIERLWRWYEHVSQPGFDPDNPEFYNDVFYRTPIRHFDPGKTQKFKCSYHAYLTGEMTLSELVPVKSFYAELDAA